jgi:hypothetical protein
VNSDWSFDKIFRKILLEQESKSTPSNENGPIHSSPNYTWDWIFRITPPPRAKTAASGYHQSTKQERKSPTEKSNKAQIKIEVRPRVKRNFTPQQLEALKVFSNVGGITIDEFATDEEIKKSFKKLARQFHPDFNPSGASSFRVLHQAYRILLK